jgi:hypothetical protein
MKGGVLASDPKVDSTFGINPMLVNFGASLSAENRKPLFRTMRHSFN